MTLRLSITKSLIILYCTVSPLMQIIDSAVSKHSNTTINLSAFYMKSYFHTAHISHKIYMNGIELKWDVDCARNLKR